MFIVFSYSLSERVKLLPVFRIYPCRGLRLLIMYFPGCKGNH